MSDPITTVVTVVSEHPQAAAAVASIYGVVKPFLAKILGPGAEEIGEIGRDYIKGKRAKNVERTLTDANRHLSDVGREAQEVPLATLVPLLESASLQDEPTLAEQWAALLANAADSAKRVTVQPGFTEVLRQLSLTDTQVLRLIYQQVQIDFSAPAYRLSSIETKGIEQILSLTRNELVVSIDNLVRLRLCDANDSSLIQAVKHSSQILVADDVYPTAFGLAFLTAVTPPTL